MTSSSLASKHDKVGIDLYSFCTLNTIKQLQNAGHIFQKNVSNKLDHLIRLYLLHRNCPRYENLYIVNSVASSYFKNRHTSTYTDVYKRQLQY